MYDNISKDHGVFSEVVRWGTSWLFL